MRTERVVTNLTCNQNCTWCTQRSARDVPAFVAGAAVGARIDEALAKGAEEIVLTGGEPSLRRDLAALITRAARGGASVALETNATLLDDARALALREAGLSLARVNLAGVDARLDACTRDEGGFARTLRGVEALLRAGVKTELAVTLLRSTLELVPELPRVLVQRLEPIGRLEALVLLVPTSAPEPADLLRYEDAVGPILALDACAREVGLTVRLSSDVRPPPCVFAPRSRAAHLFALTRGGARRPGHRHVPACEACNLVDRCAGFDEAYLARGDPREVHPIVDDRTRRRLSIVDSVAEQIRREFLTFGRSEKTAGEPVEEAIVRVQFHCNQACRFCFVSTHLPAPDDAAIRAAIVAAAGRGARVVLSGGEPTLSPRLLDYVRLARAHGPHPVTLETNAVRLGEPSLAQALVDAGVGVTFVSLHGCRAEISDAITEAPGTFDKTLAGIDRLAALGVTLVLNFVICERNYRELEAQVAFVHARWPGALLNISFVAPSADVVPQERSLVPRYSDVRPYLARALERAAELGLAVGGFENMSGLPLCLVPTSTAPDATNATNSTIARAFELGDLPEGLDRGEFVRADACRACALGAKCYGLRRGYAEIWGTSELRAVEAKT